MFRLFNSKDSSIVGGVYTNNAGLFNLENLPYGNYFGVMTLLGAEGADTLDDIKLSASIKTANLGVIKSKLSNISVIREVKVIGESDVLKAGIDKKIYNVEEDLSVRGGTANEVLSNIPSVELDQEGRVTLRGSGTVTVLIDGRPSSISGGNGKTLLDALPAGSIERIEVITNPSAKYDPDGTSGIINIVLKKNKLKGFNGMVATNLGSGDITGGNVADGSLSLSYRNAKLNVYGTYSGRYLDGYRNNYSYLTQSFTDGSAITIDQNRLGTDLDAGQTFRLGSDFYLKTRHLLGVSLTGNLGVRNRTGEQWNSLYDENNNLLSFWKRDSDDPAYHKNLDFNLNYKYDLKNDRGNLIVDINQSLGDKDIEGYYTQQFFTTDTSALNLNPIRQQLFNNERNNITTAQMDLVYVFPRINARMEGGIKGIYKNLGVDTYSESLDTIMGIYKEDTLANFNYSYNEQVYSAYGVFGQQIKKFKYQFGLRVEQAYQIPNLISDSIRIVNDYFNFFPSGHLKYSLTDHSELSLSYSRRINRAQSDDMNPFTSYADPYNLRRGNPFLLPEYINSYDLGYMIDRKVITVTTSLFYRHTTGVISRVKEFYVDNTSAMTFANIDESHSLGTEFILQLKPYKFWRNTLSINANYIRYEDDNSSQNWNVEGFMWNLKYMGAVEFWNRTASIQINAAYNGPRVSVQGVAQRRGPVDISGEKTFKNGKISVGFRITDIFNRQGFVMKIDQVGITQESEFKWLTRRYYLTFSYKFGKLEISNKRPAGGDGGFDL